MGHNYTHIILNWLHQAGIIFESRTISGFEIRFLRDKIQNDI
jgi:hypothetical protein